MVAAVLPVILLRTVFRAASRPDREAFGSVEPGAPRGLRSVHNLPLEATNRAEHILLPTSDLRTAVVTALQKQEESHKGNRGEDADREEEAQRGGVRTQGQINYRDEDEAGAEARERTQAEVPEPEKTEGVHQEAPGRNTEEAGGTEAHQTH